MRCQENKDGWPAPMRPPNLTPSAITTGFGLYGAGFRPERPVSHTLKQLLERNCLRMPPASLRRTQYIMFGRWIDLLQPLSLTDLRDHDASSYTVDLQLGASIPFPGRKNETNCPAIAQLCQHAVFLLLKISNLIELKTACYPLETAVHRHPSASRRARTGRGA